MNAYLYVLDTLADWEIGYVTAELHSGRYLDPDKPPVSLSRTGNTTAPVRTMGGLFVTPDEEIDGVAFGAGDLLILPGGDTWAEERNQKVIGMVPGLLERGVVIAAICGATIALAAKGALNDKAHTSNHREYLETACPAYAGSKHYIESPAVAANGLITATGLAPLEFAHEIFKETGVMKKKTCEAWYRLFKTGEVRYYHELMDSLNP